MRSAAAFWLPLEEKILELLADCADMKIEQLINAAGGSTLLIDADVIGLEETILSPDEGKARLFCR